MTGMKTILTCLIILASVSKSFAQPCKEIVGYYPSWQWYDRNKLVNPQTIDYSKYTILNYAFLKPEVDGSISFFDSWADENLLLGQIDWASGGYVPNTSLISKAHSNNVKVLPSIGGWTLSDNFPGIAADPVKRQTFAQACVNLLQTYNFDGIDLDWEYPGFAPHNGTPQDFQNFTLLLQDVRTAIDNYGASIGKPMLLTAAVGATEQHMNNVDWNSVSPLLDIINLMSYDFFGTWDATTNHNAPLFAPQQGDPEFNISHSIDLLVNTYNVPKDKITAGIAFYGRSAKTNGTPTLHGPSNGVADNVTFLIDEGTPLYYNVLLQQSLFDDHWDDIAKVPYMTGKNGLNTFLSYDNEASIELKAQHIVEQEIRGAIIWEITGDYIETVEGSGVIAHTPLVNKLNDVFCNYTPSGGGGGTGGGGSIGLDETENTWVSVYPNPATSTINLSTETNETYNVHIVDAQGKIALDFLSTNELRTFDISPLENGMYQVVITNQSGLISRTKLVKLN
jgi:chitinase